MAKEKAVVDEKWNAAVINISGTSNCTCKFRDVNEVLQSVLQECGGITAIEKIESSVSASSKIMYTPQL